MLRELGAVVASTVIAGLELTIPKEFLHNFFAT